MNYVQTKLIARFRPGLIATFLLALAAVGSPAHAARVDNLYAAEVPMQSGSRGLQNAFDAALSQVLVKVTGRREAGTVYSPKDSRKRATSTLRGAIRPVARNQNATTDGQPPQQKTETSAASQTHRSG